MQNFKTEHIFCACPKPDQSEMYVMIYFCIEWFLERRDCLLFLKISGIVDHQCLNFLFITILDETWLFVNSFLTVVELLTISV